MPRIVGDIAQLGERLPCKQEVAGSNPTISTMVFENASKQRTEGNARSAVGRCERPDANEFASERRQNGMKELCRLLRSDGYGVSADDGPIAQLARAHD